MKGPAAVYAGSFDPPTNGHLWMIRQGAELFGDLVVAIGSNPDKRCLFPVGERLEMLKESVGAAAGVRYEVFEHRYLVDFAVSVGARFILRGIRSEADFQYERGMRHVNEDLRADVTTVFLMPPRSFSEVSSSLVKGLIGPEGWESVVRRYVPEAVHARLIKADHARRA